MGTFNPFSVIGAKLAMTLCAILLGVLLLSTYNHKHTIKDMTEQRDRLLDRLAAAEKNFGICQANSRSLQTAVDRQNASVEAMGVATAEAAQRGQKALEDARRGNAGVIAKLDQLAKRPPLSPGVDQCKAAYALIGEMVK